MAKRLTDVPGIGPATERKLRRTIGRESRSTANLGDELTIREAERKLGTGKGSPLDSLLARDQKEALAEELGRAVGGVGSGVSSSSSRENPIPDERTRVGDFLVEQGTRQEAFDEFQELPADRRRADKEQRARITTDLEEWEQNISGLDFPGIDTPGRRVREQEKDIGFSLDDL
jgi:hypothetical protein